MSDTEATPGSGLLLPDTAQVFEDLATMFDRCPRCGTLQDLNEAWIQKKVWGGRFSQENKTLICAPCDEDWRAFVEARQMTTADLESMQELYEEFLQTPVSEEGGAEFRRLWALKELSGLRFAISEEKVRIMSRLRSRSRRLDGRYPVEDTNLGRRFIKKIGEDKWRSKTTKQSPWLVILSSEVAEVTALKDALDREIMRLLKGLSPWDNYLSVIPGIGPYLAGNLIGIIGTMRGRWCHHVHTAMKYYPPNCDCKLKDRPEVRWGPRAFPSTADLFGHALMRVDNETNRAERMVSGEKAKGNPLLKILVGVHLPMALQYTKTRRPDSPWSPLFDPRAEMEEARAQAQPPNKCPILSRDGTCDAEVVSLGMLEVKDKDGKPTGELTFGGYSCQKTHGKPHQHLWLNPAHRHTRVLRYVGKTSLSDFYHAYLALVGENLRWQSNPRICWAFKQASAERAVAEARDQNAPTREVEPDPEE